ncbi:unnamed protein product [Calypogeia fissa]
MIRGGLILPKFYTRVDEETEEKEPSTPSKKKLSYLWISLQSGRLLLLFSRLRRWGDGYCRKGIYGREILGSPMQAVMERIGLGELKNVKLTVLMLGILNLAILATAVLVAVGTSHAKCSRNLICGAVLMALAAGLRLLWMLGMGFAQAVTASTMIAEGKDAFPPPSSIITRRQRRRWYMRWLWWSRLGTIMTVLQVSVLSYFLWFLARNVSISDRHVIFCSTGDTHLEQIWVMVLMLALPTVGCIIVFAQCCVGSDVLAWRLLYGAHYEAWRAHYRQMFDYGIREVLCCLGRRRYMSVLEEDEVNSVSALLGDLVAYRAAGASHLEVIAGVALLRQESPKMSPMEEFPPAPNALLTEAALLHPYAVAAYTGPLLDVGRHPLTFPCAWLYRQGVLTPWNRNRRPALEGDNWWRGHAAAFLTHAQLPPEALRQGRVLQTNRESVYFVVVLKQLRSVVVAVRGTETPEDLITDGLGRECALTKSDLRGILENNTISDRVKQELSGTMPHFGHVGVIEAARELAMQLDNLLEDEEIFKLAASTRTRSDSKSATSLNGSQALLSNKKGLLSSLLEPGAECEGFSLRFVGHSLGGAIATLTALRLASRFPNIHVYAFGVLPCIDLVTAESCSTFVTSIIYNDEFSSRLSVAAVMRLRAAALRALATDSNTDSALVSKLTRRLFKTKSQSDSEAGDSSQGSRRRRRRYSNALKGAEINEEEEVALMGSESDGEGDERERHADIPVSIELLDNGMPKDMEFSPGSNVQELWPAEMFVPGLVIHLIRTAGDSQWFSLPKSLTFSKDLKVEERPQHRAVLKDRKFFRDILVSPAMFLDHMPWKCQYALNDVLEQLSGGKQRQESGPVETTTEV